MMRPVGLVDQQGRHKPRSQRTKLDDYELGIWLAAAIGGCLVLPVLIVLIWWLA